MSSTTKIKERPILYSGPMALATLEDRKTQTRRMVKETLVDQDEVYKQSGTRYGWMNWRYGWMNCADIGKPQDFRVTGPVGVVASLGGPTVIRCPYGKPGDRLWVREAFGFCTTTTGHAAIRFKADGAAYGILATDEGEGDCCGLGRRIEHICDFGPQRWKPSIHMPRWASRILLELTDVRVQRLQEISEADIQAEGVPAHVAEITFRKCYRDSDERAAQRRKCFRELWDSINGPGSWDANPWVWALTFKRLEGANGR